MLDNLLDTSGVLSTLFQGRKATFLSARALFGFESYWNVAGNDPWISADGRGYLSHDTWASVDDPFQDTIHGTVAQTGMAPWALEGNRRSILHPVLIMPS